MKKIVTSIFVALFLVGCKSSYDVTLNNGMQFTGVSRPKLNKEKGMYVFKNATGRSYSIPESRIRSIEPHADRQAQFKGSSDANQFNSSGR